jgi:hypothetical protein
MVWNEWKEGDMPKVPINIEAAAFLRELPIEGIFATHAKRLAERLEGRLSEQNLVARRAARRRCLKARRITALD